MKLGPILKTTLAAACFVALASSGVDSGMTSATATAGTATTTDITVAATGAAPNVVTLQFDNGADTLTDGQLATAVVQLDKAYFDNPPAEVEISAPGVKFGRTKFTFTRGQPDTYVQRMTCRTDGGSSPGKDGVVVDVPVTITSRLPVVLPPPALVTPAPAMTPVAMQAPPQLRGRARGWGWGRGPYQAQTQQTPPPTQAPVAAATTATATVPTTIQTQTTTTTTQKQQVKRRVVNSGKCSGWGDPHLVTFDGVAYDFQTAGVFRLVQSRNFYVQVFQEKCTPVLNLGEHAPSCYQGVAVAFGPSVARFLIAADGKIAVAKSASSLQWLSVEKLAGQTDGYRVFVAADEPTYVDITLATWINNYPYLNVALQVSPYFKDASVAGLMGNWNGNPADDLRDNNKLTALHGASLTDNLFTCMGGECTKFLGAGSEQDALALALPDTVSLLHQGYTALPAASLSVASFRTVLKPLGKAARMRQLRRTEGERGEQDQGQGQGQGRPGTDEDIFTFGAVGGGGGDNSTTTLADNGNNNDNNRDNGDSSAGADADKTTAAVTPTPEVEPLVADVSARAAQLCSDAITGVPMCSKYVRNTDFFVHNVCFEDAVLLGDLSVVDNTKLSYLRECRRELDARLAANTSSAAETSVLKSDRLVLSFGDLSQCASDCSSRGTCLAAGCKCDLGFTGFRCDIAI